MVEELDLLRLPVIFEVRNDKDRGLLIESLKAPDSDVYFFKRDDQPLRRHCEQMQIIVRKANVLRSKKLKVDLSEFIHEYYRSADKSIVFRATKLKSVTQQIEKVHEMRINKEVGIMKRKSTIALNKEAKIAEKEEKLLAKMKENEEKFQAEREKRIDEFQRAQGEYGSDQIPTGRGNGSNGSSGSGHKFTRNVVGQQSLRCSDRPQISCNDNNLQLPAHMNIQQFGNRFHHVNHLLHDSRGKFLNFFDHENRLTHSFGNGITSQPHNYVENVVVPVQEKEEGQANSVDESQSRAKEMNPQDVPCDELREYNSSDEMAERKKLIDEFEQAQGEYGSDQMPTGSCSNGSRGNGSNGSRGNGSNGSSACGHKFTRNVVGQQSLRCFDRPQISCNDNNLQLPAHMNIQQFGNRFHRVNHLLHGSHGKFLNFLAHETSRPHNYVENVVPVRERDEGQANFVDESQSRAKEMNPQDVPLPPDDEMRENNSSDEMQE